MSRGPDFEQPPVEEVALSVQYAPLPGMTTAHVAQYWESVRDRFPRWEEASPIEPTVELFGVPKIGLPRFAFSVEGGILPHRALFVDAHSVELVQVQRDRFVRNWRRRPDATEYPRYPVLRDRFQADFGEFLSFLGRQGLAGPEINQCEVTYVNHIVPGGGWQRHGDVHRVLTTISGELSDEFLPEPETIEATFRYVFFWPGSEESAGRLHVAVRPVYRVSDDTPLLAITLTARGRPRGNDVASVTAWMDVGHDFLVHGFASMTTPEMHRLWGRRDVH